MRGLGRGQQRKGAATAARRRGRRRLRGSPSPPPSVGLWGPSTPRMSCGWRLCSQGGHACSRSQNEVEVTEVFLPHLAKLDAHSVRGQRLSGQQVRAEMDIQRAQLHHKPECLWRLCAFPHLDGRPTSAVLTHALATFDVPDRSIVS